MKKVVCYFCKSYSEPYAIKADKKNTWEIYCSVCGNKMFNKFSRTNPELFDDSQRVRVVESTT